MFSDFGFSGWKKIPEGLFRDRLCKRNIRITVSDREKDGIPSDRVLRLVPRCVALGIGCKRGTPAEKIRETVEDAMRRNGIDLRSVVFAVASINIKSRNRGSSILQIRCRSRFTFSSEELNSQPGTFTESEFVKDDGNRKCSARSAVAACRMGARDCRILFKKEAGDGVTVGGARMIPGCKYAAALVMYTDNRREETMMILVNGGSSSGKAAFAESLILNRIKENGWKKIRPAHPGIWRR